MLRKYSILLHGEMVFGEVALDKDVLAVGELIIT